MKVSEIFGIEVEESKDAGEIAEYCGGDIVFRRWLATLIDFLVLGGIFFFPLGIADKYYNKTSFIWNILVIILIICYHFIQEAITGYTIGKFILRIKVVDLYFEPPGFQKSLIRTLFRLLEINPLLLGGVPAGIAVIYSKKGQRIGDRVAKTYVLKCRDIKKQSKSPVKNRISLIIAICTIVAWIIGVIGFCDYTGITKSAFKSKDKNIVSSDKSLQITCPQSWSKMKEEMLFSRENEVKLYAVRKDGSGSALVIKENSNIIDKNIEPKAFIKVFEKYSRIKCEFISATAPKAITINGYSAMQFEMSTKWEGKKIDVLITTIQTKDNAYTLLCENFDGKIDVRELYKIVGSFKEIKQEK